MKAKLRHYIIYTLFGVLGGLGAAALRHHFGVLSDNPLAAESGSLPDTVGFLRYSALNMRALLAIFIFGFTLYAASAGIISVVYTGVNCGLIIYAYSTSGYGTFFIVLVSVLSAGISACAVYAAVSAACDRSFMKTAAPEVKSLLHEDMPRDFISSLLTALAISMALWCAMYFITSYFPI